MKTLVILRKASTDEGTFGETRLGDVSLKTLELPWRDNKTGLSCIPEGEYRAIWHESPSKGWVYWLQGAEPRTHVLIHSANFAGDKTLGWDAELEGCIALGLGVGTLKNHHGKDQRAITSSKVACNQFYQWANKEPIMVQIHGVIGHP